MSDEPIMDPHAELPSAVAHKRTRISPLWVVPLLAVGLVGYLGYRALATHGPTIAVTFKTAAGLRVEQTEVKYKSVTLGTVRGIELSDDADHVTVHIDMDARAEPMLTTHASLWVVRPRLQTGGIAALQTGLETLVSGAYIELDPGPAGGERREHFKGLEEPPAVRSGEPGTTFFLRAEEVGSLGVGSPVLHRQVPVGEVLGVDLSEETGMVSIRAFVRAPSDKLVREQTCFWNASGLDVGMGASGLHVEVASMRALLSGGIAFQTPREAASAPTVEAGHSFPLLDSEAAAETVLRGPAVPYVAYFSDSVQGLSEGSAVTLFGMQVGNVIDLHLVLDPVHKQKLVARVGFVLQPQRALSSEAAKLLYPDAMRKQATLGLSVLLETSSYVSGEKALSLSYVPNATPGPLAEEDGTLVLPSHTRGITAMTDALSDVAARLNTIPFTQIGNSLQHALRGVDQLVGGPKLTHAVDELSATLEEVRKLASEARTGLAPALSRLPAIASHVDEAVANANAALSSVAGEDGQLSRDARRALDQVADMARSVRLLAEFLERHPETLVRGRVPEKEP
jgi:paraquat-inducible protein B